MNHEEAYFKDLLPEIGNYVLSRGASAFDHSVIAERTASYSAEEVEEILSYVVENEEIRHLEHQDGEWQFLTFDADRWEEVERELEEDPKPHPEKLPEIKSRIKELSAQEYGKLRNNLGEVYEGLRDVKDERSSIRSKDLKEKVRVRAPEIGVVLSGLAAAGLIKKYRDSNVYESDSADIERIEELKDAVKQVDSFEEFKALIDGKK